MRLSWPLVGPDWAIVMETDDRKAHSFIELLHKAILTKWGLNVARPEQEQQCETSRRGRWMRVWGRTGEKPRWK